MESSVREGKRDNGTEDRHGDGGADDDGDHGTA
jgi:hypothetical protein